MIHDPTSILQLAKLIESPELPWADLRQIVLEKRPDCIDTARALYCGPEIERAIPARQYEFIVGRVAAGTLLEELGLSASWHWVPSIARRPVWPGGVLGSISHSEKIVCVAIGPRMRPLQSIGIDVEYLIQSRETLKAIEMCFKKDELQLLMSVEHGALIGFSAKEALFKCLNPLFGKYFDFLDAKIAAIDVSSQTFKIELLIALSPHATKSTIIVGHYRLFAEHVWTGILWSAT
ncbi:4'-phosphopantetheinyl transferase EntD [Variovorax paradoxus]|uniref:4'-phosphopantetheinyl transferase family protein n=1 Tax=Variovorax paradoxus TaxID=34073 RepID=UPI001AE44623|nr:4'-phosphopantetheinyl transferase superfamily protein [Variovorax paradoxus]MDP9968768.1 4'-phosphopantetheinyl transferase EntD [Variovorax paradoxus]